MFALQSPKNQNKLMKRRQEEHMQVKNWTGPSVWSRVSNDGMPNQLQMLYENLDLSKIKENFFNILKSG